VQIWASVICPLSLERCISVNRRLRPLPGIRKFSANASARRSEADCRFLSLRKVISAR
jgi:hypothetical protein